MKLALASILLLLPVAANAQSYQCRAPSGLSAPATSKPASEPRRVKPVTGYTLALSWSPEFCRTRMDSRRDRSQCSGDDGSFAFILHGLWPETRGPAYPQWCAATKPLPPAVVMRNFCMMPTTRLMAHEWAKHGTCMTKRPETYFRVSRIMFDAVRFPDMDRLSRKPLTAGQLREAFAAANDGVTPENGADEGQPARLVAGGETLSGQKFPADAMPGSYAGGEGRCVGEDLARGLVPLRRQGAISCSSIFLSQ